MKKLALLVAAIVIMATGCSTPETTSGHTSAPGKRRVALVMKSLANEFFSTMADGAARHQAAHAATYDLIVNGIKTIGSIRTIGSISGVATVT